MSSIDWWAKGSGTPLDRARSRTPKPTGLTKSPGGGWNVDTLTNEGAWGSRVSVGMDELGFTKTLPGDRTAQEVQYNSEKAVAIRNADLMRQAVNAIGDSRDMATGLLESYRPGGSASIASGIQMQAGVGMANMLAASRTQAPNLLFNWDERQRQMSRSRADRNMYIGIGTKLATTAISALPGLINGTTADPGTNVWDALSAGASAAGNVMVNRANEGPPGPSGPTSGQPGAQGAPTSPGGAGQAPGASGQTAGQPGAQGAPTQPGGYGAAPIQGGAGAQGAPQGGSPGGFPTSPMGGGPGQGPAGGGGPAAMGGGAGGASGGAGGGAPMGPVAAGYNSGVPSALSATGQAPGTLGGQDPGDASGGRLLRDAQSQGRDSSMTMRANIMEYPDILPIKSTKAYLDWMDSVFFGDLRKSNQMDASSFAGSSYSMQDQ